MKQLIVMRHATAEGLLGVSDFERPLTAQGHAEAERVGGWLVDHGWVPDLALCSEALRVRETWAGVVRGLGTAPPSRFDPTMYDASAAELLQIASEVEEGPGCVMLVAHNPSVSHLAFDLTERTDPEGRERLRAGFRPATAAVFELRGERYLDLPQTRARLIDFVEAQSLA